MRTNLIHVCDFQLRRSSVTQFKGPQLLSTSVANIIPISANNTAFITQGSNTYLEHIPGTNLIISLHQHPTQRIGSLQVIDTAEQKVVYNFAPRQFSK